jgi:hydrogenase expression/formation protein HypE
VFDSAAADRTLDVSGWSCPVPLSEYEQVMIGHGGGGKLSAELVTHLFRPAFASDPTEVLHDAATVVVGGQRLAFSTDSYVVHPLFFPGGCIGDLAVNGTVNDLAMAGAVPVALSCGFIVEEGLPLDVLGRVADAMGKAAAYAGVRIVTGDTKVVDSGLADGLYVNTAGIGLIPEGVDIRPDRATPGDVVILSGPIGAHGIAVLSERERLEFATTVRSDSAPLAALVAAMLAACPGVHVLRDPTRGGVTASLCEIASGAHAGIDYDEVAIPVPEEVAAACSLLGLDPMSVANEGRLVAIAAESDAERLLAVMRSHPDGREAVAIGRVVADHPGMVVARTALGARRVVDLPLGEQLPRIC